MENNLILIGNTFYSQRTPNSKTILYALIKEKVETLDETPPELEEVLYMFKEMERNPSHYFNYSFVDDGIKIDVVKKSAGNIVKIPSQIDEFPVTAIRKELLINNELVEQIILPNTIKSLPEGAFASSKMLRSVILPESITEIPKYCFSHCGRLFDINLSNVKKIKDHAFTETLLSEIDLSNIEELGVSAFANSLILSYVKFSDKLKEVPEYCFSNCNDLKYVKLSDNITKIGDSAFSNCISLREINFPQNLTFIGTCAFLGCKSLKTFNAPSNLKIIAESAFKRSGLENIIINENIERLFSDVFKGCSELISIYIPENAYIPITSVFDFKAIDKIKTTKENKIEKDEIGRG